MIMANAKGSPILRIGIAGLGIAGSSIIPAVLKHPYLKLTAASTRSKERLEKFRSDYQAETYQNFEDLCTSRSVDAIYIATPTELHTEHVILAAEQKKHIIVEKPMAITLEAAERMIQAVERNGVRMIVGHSHSFEPPILKIREIVKSGRLGKLKMINNWYFNDWLYRPRTPEELDTKQGGGVTFRQGSHQFDIIRFIGGGLVRSVRASTGIWDPTRPTEGAHTVFLDFVDGTVATAVYNGYDHFHTTELTFGIGEGGPLTTSREYAQARKLLRRAKNANDEIELKNQAGYGGNRAKNYDQKEQNHPFFGLTIVSCERGDIRQSPNGLIVYGEEEKYEISIPKNVTGRDAVVSELYDAVVYERTPIHDGRWAKANLEVCLAVLESAKNRREVHLSHQTEVVDE
jgi:phthalate 4,5-cis-dihydrodiol dehydrogenase